MIWVLIYLAVGLIVALALLPQISETARELSDHWATEYELIAITVILWPYIISPWG